MTGASSSATFRQPATDADVSGLVVLLHGVGSSADAMGWIADELAAGAPAIALFVPNAPHRFDLAPTGFQWFSISGVTEDNRAARVQEANARLVPLIEAEQKRLGLGWDRTVIVGFSQGAMLALTMAATLDPSPALTVALAGRLALPIAPGQTSRGRVLLSHGSADAVVPFEEMARASAQLQMLGCEVGTLAIPGHGHSVLPQQIATVGDILGQTLRPGRCQRGRMGQCSSL